MTKQIVYFVSGEGRDVCGEKERQNLRIFAGNSGGVYDSVVDCFVCEQQAANVPYAAGVGDAAPSAGGGAARGATPSR